MEIQTSRLLLREYVENDFEDMYAFESDPLVVQYVCYGPYSEECQRHESCLRKQKRGRGNWRDVAIYALLEDEWADDFVF